MKIAVTAWQFGTDGIASELAKQGEIAESMGFDSFWLPENHFSGPAALPAPLMLLASIASRTSTIKLGTTSYLLPIRHPILAAEEVAVLDRLSGGRVILGIGRGFQDAMFKTFDIPVSDKRKRFKANLAAMISAWRGEPIDQYEGADIFLAPLPVQKPHPPLWVAAFGPLAIKQAGSLGLPYIASPVETLTSLTDKIAAHRDHVDTAGHPTVNVTPVMRTIFITEDRRLENKVRDTLAAEVAGLFRDQDTLPDDWAIIGSPAKVAEKISEYQETLGLDYLIARGRIAGVSNEVQLRSHEWLLNVAS